MNKEFMNSLTRSMHRTGLKLRKHSPEILVVAGVIGTVTSTVMACKATKKLDDVLAESKAKVEKIENYIEENGYPDDYSEEDKKKEITSIKVKSAVEVVKLYAPSVILGTLSMTAMISSNQILRKRNAALAAAYIAVDKSFKEYRGRVVERFGKDLDRELRYNLKTKELEEIVVDENGETTIEKKTVTEFDIPKYSEYAVVYDCGNTGWCKDPEANRVFLQRQQNYANDKLRTEGHLFLNDVYKMLGFAKTAAGQQVGWIYDEKNPNGDNYVDFGIFDVVHKPENARFINGYERSIILDFNVDGPILHLI